jgi:hypothetical protein
MQPEFIQTALRQAIRRYVSDAVRSGSILSASHCAAEILSTYPAARAEIDERELADDVMMTAARLGIPVRIGADTHLAPLD